MMGMPSPAIKNVKRRDLPLDHGRVRVNFDSNVSSRERHVASPKPRSHGYHHVVQLSAEKASGSICST